MENLIQDIRYGVRMLVKKPGFTLVAVITLALGIGANTAIFSAVNAVLLRPLPYKSPDRLVWISGTNPGANIDTETASSPDFNDWRSQNQSFEEMAAFTRSAAIITGAGEPERVPGSFVTHGFFDVLKAEPIYGRTITPDEDRPSANSGAVLDRPGANRVVILSYGLWQRRFGGDPAIIDSTITLNSQPCVVIGVMPQDFQHPLPGDRQPAQFWMPLAADYVKEGRRSDYLGVIARLKPEVPIEQAQADMSTIMSRLEQQYPDTNTGWGAKVFPLHERFTGDVRPALLVILGAVCFLLLIACVNVANLLLSRAAARQKEMAIRTALGAGRARIIRQLLTESGLLSIAGGALGLLLAVWGMELLVALSPGNIHRLNEVGLDLRVAAFTFGVSIATGMLFGLAPALQAVNPNLNETLKEGGRNAGAASGAGRMRSVLAVAEIALALVLLVGAGLMVKSFSKLQQVDPGFNAERVLGIDLLLPPARYKEPAQQVGFYRQLLDRVATVPGVESAGLTTLLPLLGSGSVIAFTVEGRPPLLPTDDTPDAEYRIVSPDYFRTLGIPLRSGRLISDQDNQDAPWAMVISESLARKYWPGQDPIGQRINLGNPAKGSPWRTVVGIVGDIHNEALDADPYPQMYAAYTQINRPVLTLVARTSSDPLSFVGAIRTQIWDMDKDLPLYNVRTMEQVFASSIARPRFNMTLIAIFAAVAMLLAAIGIYGVISYSVTQRTHEIGVRMALGASSRDVLRLVVGHGVALALTGVAIGLAGAFALTRLMASLLFNVSATDAVIFVAISLALIGVALVACAVPARRAIKVDPMVALRYE